MRARKRIWMIVAVFAACAYALGCGPEGDGSDEGTSPLDPGAEQGQEASQTESAEGVQGVTGDPVKEPCLIGMPCYSNDDEPGDQEIVVGEIDGVPAPGSECPWDQEAEGVGFEKGDLMQSVSLVDCNGDALDMQEVTCGSTVGWVYFYRGPS